MAVARIFNRFLASELLRSCSYLVVIREKGKKVSSYSQERKSRIKLFALFVLGRVAAVITYTV